MKNLTLHCQALAAALLCTSLMLSAANSSTVFLSQDPCSLAAPSSLGATVTSPSSATLNWSAVSGAYGYRVRVQPLPEGAPVADFVSFSLSAGISGLTSGATYRCLVSAVCSDNSESPGQGNSIVIDIIINYNSPPDEATATFLPDSVQPEPVVLGNPFRETLKIYQAGVRAGVCRVRLYNTSGRLVLDQTANWSADGEITLHTFSLPPGCYTLIVDTGGRRRILQVLKHE